MGKQHTDQRDRTMSLLRILYNETDESHPLPLTALVQRLEAAGIRAERKSLYRDLAAFKRHGIEVEYRPGGDGGWYLTGRTLDRSELRQVIDAVMVYPWMTDPVRASLLDKLASLAPAHARRGLRRPVLRPRRSAMDPADLRPVLDRLHAALQAGKAITFYPVDYGVEKTLRATGGRLVVSPKGLLWHRERYVLLAWDHRARAMRLFRPDRMAQVQLTGMPAQGPEVNLRHWTGAPFGLDPELRCRVCLRCRDGLAGEILDRFGRDVVLMPEEGGFSVLSEVVMGPAFWAWLTELGDQAEVVSPPWAAKVWAERCRSRGPSVTASQPPKAG